MNEKARDFGFDRPIDFPKGSFDLSQSRQGSYDLGPLYPVYVTECLPGDKIEIHNTLNLAFNETLSAIRHEVNAYVDWYFVPYGCMPNLTVAEDTELGGMTNQQKLDYYDPRYGFRNAFFQKLITGGFDGNNSDTMLGKIPTANSVTTGSLWDHFGLPMTIGSSDYASNPVMYALWVAYTLIWNWNYRDENWQAAYNPTGATLTVAGDPSMSINGVVSVDASPLYTDWEKDYFTTSLKAQQRGTAQAVTVNGVAAAVYSTAVAGALTSTALAWPAVSASGSSPVSYNSSNHQPYDGGSKAALEAGAVNNGAVSIPAANLNANTINITGLGINVADLRLSVATQRVLERNARAGARESEFYYAHYNDGPTDNRGDKPYFIGRFKQPIIFADVTNLAVAGTPANGTDPTIATQTMGHRQSKGDASGQGYVGTYHAKEFGILMAVMSIRPRAMYYQKTTKYWFGGRGKFDFPLPEFANLSEQPVYTRELSPATAGSPYPATVFGYQGRYDEYRQMVNDAVGLLRPTGSAGGTANLRSWNMGRQFSGTPVQGDTFLKIDPSLIKAANFVYTQSSIPMMIGTVGNIVKVNGRPLPQIAQPGLMDHI